MRCRWRPSARRRCCRRASCNARPELALLPTRGLECRKNMHEERLAITCLVVHDVRIEYARRLAIGCRDSVNMIVVVGVDVVKVDISTDHGERVLVEARSCCNGFELDRFFT